MLRGIQNDLTETKNEVRRIDNKLEHIMNKTRSHDEKINELCTDTQKHSIKLNQLEQHSRNECIKIFGLKLGSSEQQKSNHYVKRMAYEHVLKPLLNLAVQDKEDDLESVPDINSLIKNAHILPKSSKSSKDSPHPVILRLNAVDLRGKLFKYRKSFKKSNPDISFYEDLTSVNSRALQSLRNDDDVESAWTRQGSILFTRASDKSEPKKITRLKDPFSVLSSEDIDNLKVPFPKVMPISDSLAEAEDEDDPDTDAGRNRRDQN